MLSSLLEIWCGPEVDEEEGGESGSEEAGEAAAQAEQGGLAGGDAVEAGGGAGVGGAELASSSNPLPVVQHLYTEQWESRRRGLRSSSNVEG